MELGEKLESREKSETWVTIMYSRYDPKSNRCYVRLVKILQPDKTKNLLEDGTVTTNIVQDAHTRQTLAMTVHRKADKPVWGGSVGDSGLSKEMYEPARKRIEELMNEPEDK